MHLRSRKALSEITVNKPPTAPKAKVLSKTKKNPIAKAPKLKLAPTSKIAIVKAATQLEILSEIRVEPFLKPPKVALEPEKNDAANEYCIEKVRQVNVEIHIPSREIQAVTSIATPEEDTTIAPLPCSSTQIDLSHKSMRQASTDFRQKL